MTRTIRTRISGVYAIRLEDRCYVGSSRNVRKRWQEHRSKLNRGIHCNAKLQSAWSAAGAGAFRFEVLEVVVDEARLLEREQHWITQSEASDRGFNLVPTAGSVLGMRHSPEARKRIAAAGVGRPVPEAVRAACSLRMKGNKLCLGRVVSDETRARLSRALSLKPPVSKLTPEQVGEIRQLLRCGHSQRSIGRRFGVTGSTIGRIATGEAWRLV